MKADNIIHDFGRTALTPDALERVLTHNIAACREQNKLRAAGKLPAYNNGQRRNGNRRRRS